MALESHCIGSHVGPKPIYLTDVVVYPYHRAQTFSFLGDPSLICTPCLHSLRNQHQGDSPNRAGKRLPHPSATLVSSKWWSLNIYRVHWLVHAPAIRKKKTAWGCQRLECCAFRSFVLFFFSEKQMGLGCWVHSPKRTQRGHLRERLELPLEDLSSSFSPVIKIFILGRNSFCWGNSSWFQFSIYVVIFENVSIILLNKLSAGRNYPSN